MGNLISSEFYKIIKSKAFRVCTIIGIVFAIIGVVSLIFMKKLSTSLVSYNESSVEETVSTDENSAEVQDVSEIDEENYGDETGDDGFNILFGRYNFSGEGVFIIAFSETNLPMLLAIFIAIFVAGEFSNGTIKMIVTRGYSRTQIYFAKLIASIISGTVMACILVGVFVLIPTIMWGWHGDNPLNLGASDLLTNLGIQLLLNATMITVFVGLAMLFRHLGASIAISITSVSIGSIIFLIFDLITQKICHEADFDVDKLLGMPSEFYLFNTIGNMAKYGFEKNDYLITLIVVCVYSLLFTGLGLLAFNKSDIK